PQMPHQMPPGVMGAEDMGMQMPHQMPQVQGMEESPGMSQKPLMPGSVMGASNDCGCGGPQFAPGGYGPGPGFGPGQGYGPGFGYGPGPGFGQGFGPMGGAAFGMPRNIDESSEYDG
ncbi:hypothetical protein V7021_14675, partial [Cytobacillus firmus]